MIVMCSSCRGSGTSAARSAGGSQSCWRCGGSGSVSTRPLSASGVDLYDACPQAWYRRYVLSDRRSEEDPGYTQVGTAVHAALEACGLQRLTEAELRGVLGPDAPDDAVARVASAIDVLHSLRAEGWRWGDDDLERPVSGIVAGVPARGRLDLIARRPSPDGPGRGELLVIDWKTGQVQRDITAQTQVCVYAALVRDVLDHEGRVIVRIVQLTDDGRAELHDVEATDAVAEIGRRRLRSVSAAAAAGVYSARPGAACGRYGGCPYVADCQPASDWIRSAVPSAEEGAESTELASVYDDLRARVTALEAAKKAIGQRLAALLGRAKRMDAGPWRVTRVEQQRVTLGPEGVAAASEAAGEPEPMTWRRLAGRVQPAKVRRLLGEEAAKAAISAHDTRSRTTSYLLVRRSSP